MNYCNAARVVELVDTPDLGSGAFGCKGSSPFSRRKAGKKVTSESSSGVERHLAKVNVAGSNPVSRCFLQVCLQRTEIILITEKKITKLPSSAIELTITVEEKVLETEYSLVLRSFAKEARVAGFRKGKIPEQVLKRKFHDALTDETKKNVFDKVLQHLIDDKDSDCPPFYSQPHLVSSDPVDIEKPFTFTIKYDTYPDISIDDYKADAIETYDITIAESDIETRLREYQEQNTIVSDKKPPVIALNDLVTFDYCELDDAEQEIAASRRKNFVCTIAEGQDEYEIALELVGMKATEKKIIEKSYPADHANEQFAGTTKKIQLQINEVKTRSVPDIDDDLAQDVSAEFKTLNDLKRNIREKMELSGSTILKRYQEQQILQLLIRKTTVELPESMIGAELDNMLQQLAQQYNKQPEEMLKLLTTGENNSLETLLAAWRPRAEYNVKSALIFSHLIKEFDISISDDELKQYISEQLADDAEIDKTMEEYRTNGFLEAIRRNQSEQKLYDTLVSQSKKQEMGKIAHADILEKVRNFKEIEESDAATAEEQHDSSQ